MSSGAFALPRRTFMAMAGGAAVAAPEALIAITIDLEMARNYPTWEQTEWDYEKGNLTTREKAYAVEAARRVKAKGGLIHFFAVGRVFEQPDVDWLKEIVAAGHPVGNHTYNHVNIRATSPGSLQSRFRRAPWLIGGKQPLEVIADEIRMTSQAIRERLRVEPAGFRSPGGYPEGIEDRDSVQRILLQEGFRWASTKYVTHTGLPAYNPQPTPELSGPLPREAMESLIESQSRSQPYRYASGLIEIPMCPISDLIAFRTGRWKLPHFLAAIRKIVEDAIEHRRVWVFLGHPSCLSITDPGFQTVELICDTVLAARGRARVVDLNTIAGRI